MFVRGVRRGVQWLRYCFARVRSYAHGDSMNHVFALAVPEPGTLMLLGAALVLVARRFQRRLRTRKTAPRP